jgi:cytochrome d ubiquinol oxidase subunit II
MSLPTLWFVLVAVLFTGYFVLEGFDFGVGMLMPAIGRGRREGAVPTTVGADPDTRRRVALNTIGPVWDGNEVWLITGVGAMFAAFPDWYASVFSGFYLPILLILLALIVRVCAIEYRGKIDSPSWRSRADLAIGTGSWVPAFGWGLVFADIVHGVPMVAGGRVQAGFGEVLTPYGVLGGLTTTLLFAWHGAVFLSLKTAGEVRAQAVRLARRLTLPTAAVTLGFAVWTAVEHRHTAGWVLTTVIAAGLAAAATAAWRDRDGWAFAATTVAVAAVSALLFVSLYPAVLPSTLDHAWDLTVHNASSTPYTLRIMSWAALLVAPVVLVYQGWTYWVFRKRLSATHIPAPAGLAPR